MSDSFLKRINIRISDMCCERSFRFIPNRNTQVVHSYKDGLHLMDHEKCDLDRNFFII